MANVLYTPYKNSLLGSGTITLPIWDTDVIDAIAVTAAYTPSISSDATLADIPSGTIAGTATVTGLTISGGIVLCSDVTTFTGIAAGPDIVAIVLSLDTGDQGLYAYCDDFDSGMPVTPDGTDIVVTWNASGIFQIA